MLCHRNCGNCNLWCSPVLVRKQDLIRPSSKDSTILMFSSSKLLSTSSGRTGMRKMMWILAARARPCAARTRLFGFIATPNGALRTPRPSQLRWSFRQYFWGQIMFFYILTVCCITDMHINDIHISVILRGFSRGPSLFWSIWGQNYVNIMAPVPRIAA